MTGIVIIVVKYLEVPLGLGPPHRDAKPPLALHVEHIPVEGCSRGSTHYTSCQEGWERCRFLECPLSVEKKEKIQLDQL